MGSLLARLRGSTRSTLTLEDYAGLVNEWTFNGLSYTGQGVEQTLAGGRTSERAPTDLRSAARLHGSNAVLYACMAVRLSVFSATRFRWQRLSDGKPADMFGSRDLEILERPWPGGTTQDLLARAITDADLVGNSYHVVDTPLPRLGGDGGREVVRMRPDWVDIIAEPRVRNGARLGWRRAGYLYTEGGPGGGNDPVPLLAEEVAHFAPVPDPLASFRGMSWLTPIARELWADSAMTAHKRKFFELGATPNMIVRHDAQASMEKVLKFKELMEERHVGSDNAYRTLHLYPGADATVVGSDLKNVDFKSVQGAGESRIAAASGVPPVIVGLSEGLQGSSLNAGNYGQARRRLADGTMHPLWQNVSGSFEPLLPSQGPGTRLWYDSSGVPFLREDEKDSAEIAEMQARTIRSLVDGGYTPESVMAAVESGDWRLLAHSGLFSVQLQALGATMGDGDGDGA